MGIGNLGSAELGFTLLVALVTLALPIALAVWLIVTIRGVARRMDKLSAQVEALGAALDPRRPR